ncbi:hypothetical protein AOLI_G00118610 [Acnodon oligacanthus]
MAMRSTRHEMAPKTICRWTADVIAERARGSRYQVSTNRHAAERRCTPLLTSSSSAREKLLVFLENRQRTK